MMTLTVSFPLRVTLTDSDSLCFHTNLGMFFSSSVKNDNAVLVGLL